MTDIKDEHTPEEAQTFDTEAAATEQAASLEVVGEESLRMAGIEQIDESETVSEKGRGFLSSAREKLGSFYKKHEYDIKDLVNITSASMTGSGLGALACGAPSFMTIPMLTLGGLGMARLMYDEFTMGGIYTPMERIAGGVRNAGDAVSDAKRRAEWAARDIGSSASRAKEDVAYNIRRFVDDIKWKFRRY